jgi:uncharacterized Zn finger protein
MKVLHNAHSGPVGTATCRSCSSKLELAAADLFKRKGTSSEGDGDDVVQYKCCLCGTVNDAYNVTISTAKIPTLKEKRAQEDREDAEW